MVTLKRKIFSFSTVTLLVALTLSAIAAWYSILGLTAIFAAAVIPIMIMGGSLEVAKVVTTVWLHRFWDRAGWRLKLYLVPSVVALAFLTSMGIFGFLSKAHSDQSLVSGDVQAKVELVDEKIKISRDNIAMNQKALQQMDSQVDQLLGRTTDDKGANRAVQVRRQQAAERTRLNQEIEAEQAKIEKLNEEVAPIRAEIRKVEAEVGPIKYIAALIYGDNPDANLLERAVRWVIILIVFVFDPLALTLVIAASKGYEWMEEDELSEKEKKVDGLKKELDEIMEESNRVDQQIQTLESEINKISDDISVKTATEENNDGENVTEDHSGLFELDPEYSDETYVPDECADDERHEPTQDGIEQVFIPAPVKTTHKLVKTEGVTIQENDGGYVNYQGKSINKTALKEMHPELFITNSSREPSLETNFGTDFPKFAKKNDVFVRVDLLPNKAYKFNGNKWLEINKENDESYMHNEQYIRYLIDQIELGEYDVSLLSDNEKLQIENYLKNNNES